MRKLKSFGVNSDMIMTFFYNAVICSFIVFGSVCWGPGGNISKFDRGRWEKIVKKKQIMLWESHWTLHEKRVYRKLMQILNDPIQPLRC